jgi:hypothetical protein
MPACRDYSFLAVGANSAQDILVFIRAPPDPGSARERGSQSAADTRLVLWHWSYVARDDRHRHRSCLLRCGPPTSGVRINDEPDPRLAHAGCDVTGREIIDDQVLLADFERFLEIGERSELEGHDGTDDDGEAGAELWELLGFIDRHGRQLLELAKRGAGLI